MKFIHTLIMMVPSLLLAQLNGPEAVDHDPDTDLYYISNKSGGNILVGPAGGPYSVFTSNVSSPHGIEVVADTVYVCDGSAIKAFQIPSGALVNTYNIAGATFLNGLTSDRVGMLWFTDFSNSRLHSLDLTTGDDEVLVANTGTTPNGVIYDPVILRLIIVNWGSNAPILAYNLWSNILTTVVFNSGLNNCDGIAIGCDDQFYVSSWGAGAIHTFSNNFFTGPTLFVSGLAQPSDIHYNLDADTLVSPNFGSSTVTYHEETCLSTGYEEVQRPKINIWPNPGNGSILLDQATNGVVQVVDNSGRLILTTEIAGNELDLTSLPNGQYILTIDQEGEELPFRTIYLKTSN